MASFEEIDRQFAEARARDPSLTFARFYGDYVAPLARKGTHGTLGVSRDVGVKRFAAYQRMLELTPDMRVVDFGCGSLRIGYHTISFLQPGHYFGLDIQKEFLTLGEQMLGADLYALKQPTLRVIDQQTVAEAARFGADAVMSINVALHVRPEEIGVYFERLVRLTGKPGARLLFDARMAPEPRRFDPFGWVWPLDFIQASLAPLELARIYNKKAYPLGGEDSTTGILEFRRPLGSGDKSTTGEAITRDQ